MLKKKYRFNKDLFDTPSGFIMGDIKGVVMHPYNDVSEQGWIIGSGDEIAVVTKDGEMDSKSSGIMSIPSNEVWFATSDGEYYDPMYVQIEENVGDTFPDLPTFDREKTQAANTGSDHIYKWVFTEDVTRINDNSTGMFTEDDYGSTALPISKVFLPVNYWLNTSELEPYLLEYCRNLESFIIPNSVTSIGYGAFEYCISLSNVTIPNRVTSIGDYAFWYCSSLTSVTIGESVTSIGSSAFSGCSGLTSITIPNSVTSIGDGALYGCIFAKENFANHSVLDAEENNYWGATIVDTEIDGLLIQNDTVIDCRRYVTSAIIPEGITSIGVGAFERCSSLTSITIPNSVTSIGARTFQYCSSLISVTIGNSVTSIGNQAFSDCSSLTSIIIPNSVTSIGDYAFRGCRSLTEIICEATTPPTLGTYNNLSNVTAVYVPEESVEAYKTAANWSYYSNKIQAM